MEQTSYNKGYTDALDTVNRIIQRGTNRQSLAERDLIACLNEIIAYTHFKKQEIKEESQQIENSPVREVLRMIIIEGGE